MTLRFYDACPFGLCSEISPQGIRWRHHQPAAHDLRQGLHRLRGATDRDGRRGRSRSPACGIPAQGGCLQSREQSQRRLQSPAAEGTARHPEALLERRAVIAVLFRFKLRRRADFHRSPVHRAAANPTLKPKDKDGCAVRAILPRPERRGLSRTGSVWLTTALIKSTRQFGCSSYLPWGWLLFWPHAALPWRPFWQGTHKISRTNKSPMKK